MTTPFIDRSNKTSPLRLRPLSAPLRRDGAGPEIQKDNAELSGTRGTRPLAEALEEAKAKNPMATFGNKVGDGSRDLIQDGYKYPPNLTSQYYHAPGKVGCCADFVADSYANAGFPLGKDASSKGYNPHYCPSMINYFKKEQQLIDKNSPAHVGDAVFFDWEGDGVSNHLAIVTKVDANGRPTEIMESNAFNQPAKTTKVDPNKLDHIMAFGRLKGAGADDGAAAQLGPVTNPTQGSGPSYGGNREGHSGGRSTAPHRGGYDAPDAGNAPSLPRPPSSPAMLAALQMLYETIADAYDLDAESAKELIDAVRAGGDVKAVAKKWGVKPEKIDQLVKDVKAAAGKADEVAGENDLPLPSKEDAWGMDSAEGRKTFAAHKADIEAAAQAAGVDSKALGAALWMRNDFDLGKDPKALILKTAEDLKNNWEPKELAKSAMGALDPEGKLDEADRGATLQLFANRYAALQDKPAAVPEAAPEAKPEPK